MPKGKISAKKVIITSFLVDVSDVLLNVFVTLATGSVVMLSQSLQGFADLLASGLLYVGIKKSAKPSDSKHPFGYGREIYFWTLMSTMVTFLLTSSISIYEGIDRVINPEDLNRTGLAVLVLFLTTLTNAYSFSLSFRRLIGDKNPGQIIKYIYQSNLIETKMTLVLDLMGTVASILGFAAILTYEFTSDARFDGFGAILVGVVLAILALSLLIEIKDLIIGRSASPQTEERIKKATLKIKKVKAVLDLRTMAIGPNKVLVNMEVHLEDKLTTDEIELLIDKIKSEVKRDVPSVGHIQVELETPDRL